jgi:hypothetical protein
MNVKLRQVNKNILEDISENGVGLKYYKGLQQVSFTLTGTEYIVIEGVNELDVDFDRFKQNHSKFSPADELIYVKSSLYHNNYIAGYVDLEDIDDYFYILQESEAEQGVYQLQRLIGKHRFILQQVEELYLEEKPEYGRFYGSVNTQLGDEIKDTELFFFVGVPKETLDRISAELTSGNSSKITVSTLINSFENEADSKFGKPDIPRRLVIGENEDCLAASVKVSSEVKSVNSSEGSLLGEEDLVAFPRLLKRVEYPLWGITFLLALLVITS